MDQSAADQGEAFSVYDDGEIELFATPASTSTFTYDEASADFVPVPGGTFAFRNLAATNAMLLAGVQPGDVLEVPGTSVSAVTFGTGGLTVTTSAGTYALTNVTYAAATAGYTAAVDAATGLVAITFNDVDTFQRNVKATSGALSGDYLWSNAANWSAGVPTNGATISVGATGYDDLAALTLASLTLNATGDAVIHVTGASLTVDSLTVSGSGGSAVLDADAAATGAPVTVTVQQVATGGARRPMPEATISAT